MVPIRLTILLISLFLLALLAFANPQPATINLLFWSGEFQLYKIILGGVLFGIGMAMIYMGHIKFLRRIRADRYGKYTRYDR